jgi:hypothetical protein
MGKGWQLSACATAQRLATNCLRHSTMTIIASMEEGELNLQHNIAHENKLFAYATPFAYY